MKKMLKKIFKGIITFFSYIGRWIDRKIIVPITKFILLIGETGGKNSKSFERWLMKKNTLTFLSLLLAFIFFFLVDSKTVVLVESSAEVLYNQKVDAIYNQEAYVIEGLPETVDIVLIGRKSDLFLAKQLAQKNVTVDLSGLKPGEHKVELKYENEIESISSKLDPSTANISIYPKISESRTVTIDVLNKDALNNKLAIQSVDIDKKEIVVKGAEHTLNEVSTVKALVDINNLSEQKVGINTISDVRLIAYDKDGKVINIEMVPNKVTATISIVSPSKEVPIKIIPTGSVEFGNAISSINSDVSKVTVYGEEKVINDLQFIPINIDVSGLNEAKTYNIILEKPSGIRYISETSATVEVTLDKEVTREIENVTIEHINLDSNYKAGGLTSDSFSTTVVVKGTKTVVDNINTASIKAIIDLSGYGVGDHEVEVKVTGDEVKATYLPKTTKVKIRIKNK